MQKKILKAKTKKKNSIKSSAQPMINYLNLIGLSDNTQNLGYLITSIITENNCNIVNIKMTNLGNNLAINALITGKWNEIAKLEKSIELLTKKNNVHIYLTRNNFDDLEGSETYINYIVQATTINQSKILQELLNFFYKENIYINSVNFNSNNITSKLANLEIQVKIPIKVHIMSLREKFLNLCDNLNLDTSLEPYC